MSTVLRAILTAVVLVTTAGFVHDWLGSVQAPPPLIWWAT